MIAGPVQGARLPRLVSPALAVWLGSVCLLALAGWAALAEVDVVVSVPGTARPAGGVVTLRAPASRRIARVMAAEGDWVEAGALVILLADGAADSRWHSGAVALAARRHELSVLRAVVRRLDADGPVGDAAPDEVRLRVQELRARRARLQAELRASVSELEALEARIAAGRQLARIRDARHRAAEDAFARGALSRFELLRVWQETLGQRADLRATEEQAAALRERIAAHRHTVREVLAGERQTLATAIAALQVEIAELEATRAEAGDRRAEARVVAPSAGVLEQLSVSPGERVERGEVMAVIIPTHRPLLFEARVSPGQAAFVQPGQACRIKLDALPFARYGALPCQVESVSRDVVAPERGGGYYLVRVQPAAQALEAGGRPVRLQPGATGWVDLVASRRTVLSFVTEPLRRFAAESLREA